MVDKLRAVAERINTGISDPDTSRALVVFNLTNQPLSGLAIFHASMSWPATVPLPPVLVHDINGQATPSAITEFQAAPDKKGRVDRRQLSFALRFAVQDVPPQGWRTYIASYTSEAVPNVPEALADATPGLAVVETLRHDGDLPPVGSLYFLNPRPSEGEGGEPQRAG